MQNDLQGKALLETALENAALSEAEKRNVQHQAQSNGIAAALGSLAALLSLPKRPPKAALDPETADLTEEERLARLKQSGQYQAYQSRMAEWRAEQQRQQAAAADQAYRQEERDGYDASAGQSQASGWSPWWQRAGEWAQQNILQPVQQGWNAITHPGQTLENALVQWGAHSPTGYKVIRGLASMTASMDDPQRNPVMAAFGQALRDGIAGFSYGVRSTIDLARQTGSSLLKGDWEGVRRYGGALLEGTVKGWIWGSIQTIGHLAWGAIRTVTPIGLFETVPAWTNALQEARTGKRGGWDVALTSLFLMANLIGIAGAVNGVQNQVTRTSLTREYSELVRPLLAE